MDITQETSRRFLSTTEAGAAVGLSAARIHQLAISGEIESIRYRRRRLINAEGLRRWAAQRKELLG